MIHIRFTAPNVVLCLLFLTVAALVSAPKQTHADTAQWRKSPIPPLPAPAGDLDKRKVRLGEELFHDPRLSADDTISCASCHSLGTNGADDLAKPRGIGGSEGTFNTPTVFNSRYNFTQFWNGRADSLEKQAAGPVHNPQEMGSNWKDIVAKLNRDPSILRTFRDLYDDGITGDNIVDAIATFERTLVTVNAPFDRYLRGDRNAITAQAVRGFELFQSYGCVACHQGVNAGGNMYQPMGVIADYFAERGPEKPSDQGRYALTGREQDRHVFKVPSLRLASRTAPYFHDGSAKTLEEAVQRMAQYQLGRDEIPAKDVDAIIAFIDSLAGEYIRYGAQ